jgi:hypothetical protein
MDKIYIVTAGCSFTQSTRFIKNNDWLEREVKHILKGDYQIKYPNFLALELFKQNIEFEIHNVGKGSAGNHVIKHLYKEKINQLLDKGINANQIYSTIQLSGIYRPTRSGEDVKHIPDWEYDYLDANSLLPYNEKHDFKFLIGKHIDNINDIINFAKEKNIKTKLFWGWSNFSKKELEMRKLYDKFNEIDSNYLLNIKYDNKFDTHHNGLGVNTTYNFLKEIFNSITGIKKGYLVEGGEIGGMLECARQYRDENIDVYCSVDDLHLNTYGNYLFYKNFYKNIFEDWNIIPKNLTSIFDNDSVYNKFLNINIKICNEIYSDSVTIDKDMHENSTYRHKKYLKYLKYFNEIDGNNLI